MITIADRLTSLADLFRQGLLSAAEFQIAKARVLAEQQPAPLPVAPPVPQLPMPPPRAKPPVLNPTVTGVGMGLAAGGMGLGG